MARPAQLDDLDWLRDRYRQDGDRAIAAELGVSPGTVTRARERLGIKSASEGRRRGRPVELITPTVPALDRVTARYQQERSLTEGPAPSVFLLETRNRALRDALLTGDPVLICEALEAAAAGMILMLDHEQQGRSLS